MRIAAGMCVAALGVALVLGAKPATAVTRSDCPFKSNDDCDQWQYEQLDKELSAVVEAAIAVMERHAKADWLPEAKLLFMQAHRQWIVLRTDDCRSQVAYPGIISARTSKGKMAECQLTLTDRRIKELKARFNLQK